MTAEDKARELLLKFYPNVQWKLGQEDCVKRAKSCASIAVDEILNNVMMWWEVPVKDPYFITQKKYWTEVQQEIEKL